jgi:serine/threonine protein kinase
VLIASTATLEASTVWYDRTTRSMHGSSLTRWIDAVGNRVGHHHLLDYLGGGGLCDVYRGRHLVDGHDSAIKVLRPELRRSAGLVDRMRFEARIGMRFNHANLVRILEYGEDWIGPYFAMELLEGSTLGEILQHDPSLSPPHAAAIARQTAEGLATLHHAGFIHCDVKPSNLMILGRSEDRALSLKILDFGIARQTRHSIEHGEGAPAPSGDTVVGTPGYLAPEQLDGAHVGPKADLYALGVVLYRMISGHLPFHGTIEEMGDLQRTTHPKPLPLADGLGPLAFRLLELRPKDRPSAPDVIDVLDRLGFPPRYVDP